MNRELILEYTKEAAQKVIDRKVQQLKKSGDSMKSAEDEHRNQMSMDGTAVSSKGDYVSKYTRYANDDHKQSIADARKLNQGALRLLKAGKNKGLDTENLKYSGKGHAQEIERQEQSRHNIKHSLDEEYLNLLTSFVTQIFEDMDII